MNYTELLEKNQKTGENVGISRLQNIDKTAVFYHVVTTTRGKERVLYPDIANYRHNLLCRLCSERGIKILFSVAMLNHTHEVFLTPDWDLLSEVFRILHLNVSKYVAQKYPERKNKLKKIFSRDIAYVPIRDIRTLFYIGMYIFTNPQYMEADGKGVPYSSFWMMEKGHYVVPYDNNLYKVLFGMDGAELIGLYKSMDREKAKEYARKHFSEWTEKETREMFYKRP